MAISINSVLTFASATAFAAAYTTASFSVTAGNTYVVWSTCSSSVTVPPAITFSNGMTAVQLYSVNSPSDTSNSLTAYYAVAATTGTTTATVGSWGTSFSGTVWIEEFVGLSTTAPFLQKTSSTTSSAGSSPSTLTIGAFSSSLNGTYEWVTQLGASGAIGLSSGFTAASTIIGNSTLITDVKTGYKTVNQASMSFTWNQASFISAGVMYGAIELNVPLKTVVLTGGSTWTVPLDWGSANQIEVWGAGGNGGTGTATPRGAASGGSGGYSTISGLTLTPGAVVNFSVPAGGAGTAAPVYFNGTSLASSSVGANSAGNASTTTAGTGGSITGVIGTARAGTNGTTQTTSTGGCGGPGAPGPHGAGAAGVVNATTTGGLGGTGDAGSGGTAGTHAAGAAGGTGGSNANGGGGGGGGSTTAHFGGAGGFPGGGGGGGASTTAATGGAGAGGQIRITYVPAATVTTVTINSGTSWTVPTDFSANNIIGVFGAGGGGVGDWNWGGGGGGGGGYSQISGITLTPGASIPINVGVGGVGGNGVNAADGTATWFNGTSLATSSVGANQGAGALVGTPSPGGVGGSTTGAIGTFLAAGGNGATAGEDTSFGGPGSGGGGSGGPNGAGITAVNGIIGSGGVTYQLGVAGAAGSGGNGGAGGAGGTAVSLNGGAGAANANGGGGGGGAFADNLAGNLGGAGGFPGGGGGGADNGGPNGTGGTGAAGQIVISYIPATTPKVVSFTSSLTSTIAPKINRARKAAITSTETTSILQSFLRNRTNSFAYTEGTNQANVFTRNRRTIVNINDVSNLVPTLKKTSTIATTINENAGFAQTFIRTRPIAPAITETDSFSAAVNLRLGLALAAANTETINVSTVRARTASFTLPETITQIAAINRAVGNSFSISELEAISATIMTAGSWAFAIHESSSLLATLQKHLNVSFTDAEVTSITSALRRFRTNATAMNEILTYAINNKRNRNVSLSYSEAQQVSIMLRKINGVSFSSDAELEHFLFTMIKKEGIGAVLAQSSSMVSSIIRHRNDTLVLTELLSQLIVAKRNLSLSEVIFETEATTLAMSRQRQLGGFSIAETESILSIAVQKVKLLAASFSEFETYSFSGIRRIRKVVNEIDTVTTMLINQVSRVLALSVSSGQQEILHASLNRLLSVKTNIAEVDATSISLARKRGIMTLMTEAETLQVMLARLKLMAYIDSQQFSYTEYMLTRLRKSNLSISSHEAMVASINRVKVFITHMDQHNNFSFDVGRLLQQMLSIGETQGQAAALARLLEIAQTIANVTDMTISLSGFNPDKGIILMEWTEWQNVNGVQQLVQRSETVTFGPHKYSTTLMVKSGSETTATIKSASESTLRIKPTFENTVIIPNNTF